jgi:Alpha-galactosidase
MTKYHPVNMDYYSIFGEINCINYYVIIFMKSKLFLLAIAAMMVTSTQKLSAQTSSFKEGEFKQWAQTPPMGWNSWDCYGSTVTEDETKANADYMAANLKSYGWEYIVVDIRWFVENDKAGGYNEKNPIYVMDQYGRYLPALNRFPSAKDGKGFKHLADYVHSKGLKFGIHIMRGIPKEAVAKKLPIKGTNGHYCRSDL